MKYALQESHSRQLIDDHMRLAIRAHEESKELLSQDILQAAKEIIDAIDMGRKIVVMGNGGSASDASHIASEFIGRFSIDSRKPLPAIALTADTSVITSIANDFSFDEVFARQCSALVEDGDIVLAISTSGNSKNILAALEVCKKKNAKIILLTGRNGGKALVLTDFSIKVPSDITATIQEVHRTIIHIICSIIDDHYGRE